jgi:hypothetical protein
MLLFLNIVETILLIAIAAGVGYLVNRSVQSTGVRGKRQSLQSRRQEVYGDVVRILTLLGKTGELRKEELLEFRSRTQDAALLFDISISAYIEEIYTRGVKLMSADELLKGSDLSVGEERDKITVEHDKHLIWLADQLALIRKKFERYPDVRPVGPERGGIKSRK